MDEIEQYENKLAQGIFIANNKTDITHHHIRKQMINKAAGKGKTIKRLFYLMKQQHRVIGLLPSRIRWIHIWITIKGLH